MNMNTQGNEFELVRKCLALKRHEKPPPGYFDNFSHSVMARINSEGADAESHWILTLWNGLLRRPILAGAAGAGLFGLLLFCMVSSSGNMQPGAGAPPELTAGLPQAAPNDAASEPNSLNNVAPSLLAGESSTNPVGMPQPLPSLFPPVNFKVQPASYTRGSN